MEKRKDNKNRILNKGESQRKDGTYMYRWTDNNKKRQTVYAKTLNELRQKELEITKTEKINGSNWSDGKMPVAKLIDNYRKSRNVKVTTSKRYDYICDVLEKIDILDIAIKDIRISDAKRYMLELKSLGYGYGTIQSIKSLLSPAFQTAVEDDILVKNPFIFRLCDIIDDDRKKRRALTDEEEKKLLEFLDASGQYTNYRDDIVILLGTGLRVSELYGLTYQDVDIANKRIYVNKQLHKIDTRLYVFSPKSKAGTRTLAMTDDVKQAFISVMQKKRPVVEPIVDGYTGFIFFNQTGSVRTRKNLMTSMINMRKSFKSAGYGDIDFLTPHVLRHTFCSRMVEKGMNPKDLQIIMGHSEISTTMDVYTHKEPEKVAKEMERLISC